MNEIKAEEKKLCNEKMKVKISSFIHLSVNLSFCLFFFLRMHFFWLSLENEVTTIFSELNIIQLFIFIMENDLDNYNIKYEILYR